jgi:hypothetical protein
MPGWLVRLWMIPAALLILSAGAFASTGIHDIYERHFNPVQLLAYDYHGGDGMPTDHPIYRPGEIVSVFISRCVRVEGTLRNQVYLSLDGSPRGVALATIESAVMPGCTSRLAAVATIPADTEPGRTYTLAGVQTIQTKVGDLSVPWRTTRFYVTGAS